MFNAVKAGFWRLFGSPSEKLPNTGVAAPMIGDCVSTDAPGSIGSAVGAASVRMSAPVKQMVGIVSPHQVPMIGVRHGTEYAEQYAAAFVACVRRSYPHPVTWMVDDLLTISKTHFAGPSGNAVPPARSFLSALKRLPGVEVRQDLRGYRPNGAKATVYTIRPVESVAHTDVIAPGHTRPSSRLAA